MLHPEFNYLSSILNKINICESYKWVNNYPQCSLCFFSVGCTACSVCMLSCDIRHHYGGSLTMIGQFLWWWHVLNSPKKGSEQWAIYFGLRVQQGLKLIKSFQCSMGTGAEHPRPLQRTTLKKSIQCSGKKKGDYWWSGQHMQMKLYEITHNKVCVRQISKP